MNFLLLILTTSIASIISAHASANVRNEPISPIEMSKVDAARAELGKKLFFEPRLSRSGAISCNSCHNLAMGGDDNMSTSIGHGWNLGPINAPTVLNSKYNLAQFWDGRAKDLKEQAVGPIANPGEMGFTHKLAADMLSSIPAYEAEFKKVFGSSKITIDHVGEAIATFEETLMTPNSKFDQWLNGDDKAMNKTELAGYSLFKSKGCIGCHNGPGVGGTSYQKLGVIKPYKTKGNLLGRYEVTKKESDKGVFKVPLLRNVELTAPYLHDGSLWSLAEVVEVMADVQLGQKLKKSETDAIVAFLKTLTGDQPKITLPALPVSSISTFKPDASTGKL